MKSYDIAVMAVESAEELYEKKVDTSYLQEICDLIDTVFDECNGSAYEIEARIDDMTLSVGICMPEVVSYCKDSTISILMDMSREMVISSGDDGEIWATFVLRLC